MSYKRVVEKKGKSYGPYIYESYRDKDGKVKKRYLGKLEQPKKVSKGLFFTFILLSLFVAVLAGCSTDLFFNSGEVSSKFVGFAGNTLSLVKNSITGLVIDGGDSGSEDSGSSDSGESGSSEGPSPGSSDSGDSSSSAESSDSSTQISEESDSLVTEDLESTETFVPVEEVSETVESAEPESSSEDSNESANESEIETINNETLEAVSNETSLNETSLQEPSNETSQPSIIDNETSGGDTNLSLGNLTEPLNETILINDTILNETILNETTITNDTILNSTTLQYRAVINRPVKWIKKINLSDADNLTIELPRDSSNISILTDEEITQALEQVDSYEEVVESVDREGLAEGTILTGNVVSDIGRSEGILVRFWKWISGFTISGNVILEEEISEDILDTGDSVVLDLEGVVGNETEVAVEYTTPGPFANETDLTNGKRIIVSADDEYNYTDILAYTLLDNLTVSISDSSLSLYWYASYEDAVRYGYINASENETVEDLENESSEAVVEETINLEENLTEEPVAFENETVLENLTETSVEVINENSSEEVVDEISNESISFITGNVVLDSEQNLSGGDNVSDLIRVKVTYVPYDFDEDGFVDYVEWVVPHLSAQVYDLVLDSVNVSVDSGVKIDGEFAHLAVSSAVPYNSLVAYYPFDYDNITTALDWAGGKDLTFRNITNVTSSGKFNDGLYFPSGGAANSTSAVLPAGTTNVTFGGWIKWNRIGWDGSDFDAPITQDAGDDLGYQIYAIGSSGLVNCWDGVAATLGYSISAGTWYHVMCTHNATNETLYVNGIPRSTASAVDSVDDVAFRLGNTLSTSVYQFDGYLDEVMVFNKTLNDSEISNIYAASASRFAESGKIEIKQVGVTSGASSTNVSFDDYEKTNGSQIRVGLGEWDTSRGYKEYDLGEHAVYVDGTDDYVNVTDDDNTLDLNQMTLSAWVYANPSLDAYAGIIAKGQNSSGSEYYNNYVLRRSSSTTDIVMKIMYGGGSSSSITTCTGCLEYGKWFLISATYNGSNVTLYKDGIAKSTTLLTGSPYTDNQELRIGAWNTYDWNGSIDEVMIFNRSLNSTEIRDLYNLGRDIGYYSDASLVSWYGFDSSNASDKRGLNNGVLTGNSYVTGNNGLVASWHGDGNANDYVGGNTGTLGGGTTSAGEGVYGSAFTFNGSSYVQTGASTLLDISSTQATSHSAWVKFGSAVSGTTYHTVTMTTETGVGDNTHDKGLMVTADGKASFYVYDGAAKHANSTQLVNDGKWHHLVGIYDGSSSLIYVDGSYGGTISATGTYDFTTPQFLIGGDVGAGSTYGPFNGSIDEVMVWNRSLTASEIQELYVKGRAKFSLSSSEQNITDADTSGKYDYRNSRGIVSCWIDGLTDTCGANDGTVQGGAAWADDALNVRGNSLVLDGNGDYVLIGDKSDLELLSGTVGAWVYLNSYVDAAGIVTKATNGGNSGIAWSAGMRYTGTGGDGRLRLYLSNGTGGVSLEPTKVLDLGKWYYVTYTWNGSVMNIYVDGVLNGTATQTVAVNMTNADTVKIGANFGTGFYFNGSIDEVAIWNTALNSTEIAEIYKQSKDKHSVNTFGISTRTTNILPILKLIAGKDNFYSPFARVVTTSAPIRAFASVQNLLAPNLTLITPTASGNYNASFRYEANASDEKNVSVFTDHGLVSWWRMDDTNETHVIDYMGRNNASRYYGPSQIDGRIGKAMSFNGNTSHLVPPIFTNYTGGNMTLSTWFKTSAGESDNGYMISKPWSGSGSYNYQLYWAATGLYFQVTGNATSSLYTTSLPSKEVWHHVVATVDDSNNTRIYLDGLLNNSGVHTVRNWTPSTYSATSLALGIIYPYAAPYNGGTSLAYNGSLDEVMVWNRTLSEQEVHMLYANQSNKYLNLTLGQGTYSSVSAYAADSDGGLNKSATYSFTFDSTSPVVTFVNPTPANNYSSLDRFIPVNLTSIESNEHYALVDFNDSLVSWWRGESDARDDADSFLKLDGSGDYLSIGSVSAFNIENKTISIWAKLDAQSGHDILFSNGGANYYVSFNGGQMFVSTTNSTGSQKTGASSNGVVDIGSWHNYLWSFKVVGNDVNISFYKDGRYNSSYTHSQGYGSVYGSSFILGNFAPGQSFDVNGSLDNFLIFNRTLSDDEISEIYQVGRKSKYVGYTGLMSAWLFDDSSSTTAADSVGGRTGTYVDNARTVGAINGTMFGNAAVTRAGKFGGGFTFDGDGDYVQTSVPVLSGNKYSYGGWVKFNDIGVPLLTDGIDLVFAQDSGFGDGAYMYIEPTYISCGNGDSEAAAFAEPQTGRWYHLMCVQDGSYIYTYINGTLWASYPTSFNISALNFSFGGSPNWGGQYWMNGSVDDVVVFNKALSSAEIASLYNASASQYYVNFTNLSAKPYTFEGYAVDIGGNKVETAGYKVTVANPLNVSEQNLVAYWNFDDDPSNGYNDVKNPSSNIFTVSGAVVQNTTHAKYGNSVKFDGVSSYLNLSSIVLPDQGNMTVTFWVYNDNNDVLQTWMEFTRGSTFRFNVGSHTTGSGRTLVRSTNDYQWERDLVTNNQWNLVVLTFNATGQINSTGGYLNGQRYLDYYYDPVLTGYKDVAPAFSGSQVLLGRYSGGQYFDGYLDDLRVYNKTLNTSEVVSLYLNSPYSFNTSISSCQDLTKIKYDRVTETYNLTQNIDCGVTNPNHVNYSLHPWNSTTSGWYPTDSYLAGARVNGNGYIISDLYINRPSSGDCGLFSSIGGSDYYRRNSVVDDLHLRNYNITCLNAGGLARSFGRANVTNSSVTGYLYYKTTSGDGSTGGMFGYSSTNSSVARCWANVTIVSSGGTQIGGLSGTWDARSNTYPMVMEDVYSYSTITGATSKVGVLIGDQMGSNSQLYRGLCSGNYNCIGYEYLGGEQYYTYCDSTKYSGCVGSYSVTAKTETELKQQATYSTWNFTHIWDIDEGNNYPHLMWENYFQPNVNLIAPAESYWQENNNLFFNYTVSDDSGVASCSVYLDGILNFTNHSITSWDNPFNLSVATNQSHIVKVSCNNTGGTRRNTTNVTFSVGSVSPIIRIYQPDGFAVNRSVDVDFNWSVYSPTTFTNFTCNLSLNGLVNKSGLSVVNGQANSTTILGVPSGENTWNMSCFFQNNPNIYNFTSDKIYVDSTKPIVSVISPTSDRIKDSFIFFNTSVSDSNNASLVINFNNSLVSWWRMDDLNQNKVTDIVGNNHGSCYNQNSINLAYGKTAYQSSTYNPSYPASNAVDGSASTFQHTNTAANEWWSVDLGAVYNVTQIVLVKRSGYSTQPSNYNIQAADDLAFTSNVRDLVTKVSDSSSSINFTVVDFGGVGTRYLRVYDTASEYLNIAEFEVYNYSCNYGYGKFGNALIFDGVDDGVRVADTNNFTFAGDFAISVWAKPGTMSGYGRVYDSYNGGGFMLQNQFGSSPTNKWLFEAWNGANIIESNGAHNGDWQHIVVTRTNGLLNMYVDGVLQIDNESSSATLNGGNLLIGAAYNTNAEFNGSIDDLMIFNRSLMAAEVVALYGNQSSRHHSYNYTSLTEGLNYNFTVYAQDAAGNINSSSKTVEFVAGIAGISAVYPSSDVAANLHDFFNVTVNVTCTGKDCGTFNVSLDPIGTCNPDNMVCDSNCDLMDGSSIGSVWAYDPGWGLEGYCYDAVSSAPYTIWQADYCGISWGFTQECANNYYWDGFYDFSLTCPSYEENGRAVVLGDCYCEDYSASRLGCFEIFDFSHPFFAGTGASGKGGLVNTTIGATPFYTNGSNPVEVTLLENQSQLITWWVNATGSEGKYEFYTYTNRSGVLNETVHYNVSIVGYPTVNFTSNSDFNRTYGRDSVFVNVSGSSTGNVSTLIDFNNSILGWWTMDDVSGSTVIDYMNKNNGTLVGGASQVSGKMGKAMSMAGEAAVNLGDRDLTDQFTIVGWMKGSTGDFDNAYPYSGLIEKSSSYLIECDFGGIRVDTFGLSDTSYRVAGACPSSDEGGWHQWATTYNGTRLSIYKDGVFVGSEDKTGTLTQNNNNAYLGYGIGSNTKFNGSIDDVIILNRSLSADEVSALYGNTSVKYAARNFTGLSDGEYNVTGYAQSSAGRISSTGSRIVTLDRVAPRVQFVSPTPQNGNVSNKDSIYVNVTSSDVRGNVSTFVDLNNSLIGWWRFDDVNGSGSLTDRGSLNRTMGLQNYSDVGIDAGKSYFIDNATFGRGYRFVETVQNGNGNYFMTSRANNCDYANLDCGSKTISLWVRPVSGGYNGMILGTMYATLETQSTGGWHLRMNSDTTMSFNWRDDSQEFTTSYDSVAATVTSGQWHHVLILANNTYVGFYVDGVLVDSEINFGGFGEAKGNYQNDNLMLGGGYNVSYLYGYNGEMDDVMIFNRSLTVAEINSLYANSSSRYLDVNLSSLRGGRYNVTVYAQDSSGNLNQTESRNITIVTPPSIFVDYPYNGSTVSVSSGLTLNYTYLGGGVEADACWYSINGGSNVTVPGCIDTTINVNQGWSNVTVYANDSQGQLASNVTTFFVDSIYPKLFVDEPFDVAYSNGTDVTVDISTPEGATGSLVSNLDNGLVSWWTFDSYNSTHVFDYMGRKNGNLTGGARIISNGHRASALNNSDSANVMLIPGTIDLSTNWTFASWFWYPIEEVTHYRTLIRGAAGDHQILVQVNNYNLGAYDNVGGTNFRDSGYDINVLSTGWHQIVAMQNASGIYYYMDGVRVGAILGYTSTTDIYSVGGLFNPGQEWGTIDDAMVFNRSLTASEILGLYNATRVNYNTTLATGNHTYQAFAQDSSGNINASTVFGFEVDPTIPFVGFNLTTPSDGTQQPETYIDVGMSVADQYGSYSFVDLDSSLVGYWRGEDGANDTTGRNNGSFGGGAGITRNGKFGKAFTFDGNGDYVNITGFGSVAPTSEVAISLWVYAPLAHQNLALILNPDSGLNRIGFSPCYGDGNTYWDFGSIPGGGRLSYTSPSDCTDRWNHYVLLSSSSSNSMQIYRNGILEASSGTHSNFTSGTYALVFGGDRSSYWFNGSFDEVMVFNRTLSTSEIEQLYNASKGYYMNRFSNLEDPATHTIKGYTVDTAGNINSTEERSVYVDSTLTNVCRTLGEANTVYTLLGNVTATNANCMVVGAHNVTLDLNGYYILGNSSNTNGVLNSQYDNFTLKNGYINGFTYQFYSTGITNKSNITNMTFSNAISSGIYATLYNSSISNVTFRNTPYGIALGGNYTNLTNFYSLNSSYGVDNAGAYFSGLVNGLVDGGVITNNGYGRGIYIYDSSVVSTGSVFKNVNISSAEIGVSVRGAGLFTEGSSFENISILGSSKTDYYLYNSSLEGYDFVGDSLVIENGYGAVNYTNSTIYANGTNMSGIFEITNNNVFVNASRDLAFNTTANITLKGLVVPFAEARVDFEDDGSFIDCPLEICTNLSYADSIFIYNVTHFTSYSSEDFNNVPDTPPFVYLNTSGGENISSESLICNTHTSDPDGDTLTVSVDWYVNGGYNQTRNYTVANATNFSAVLTHGNTTKTDVWSCAVKFIDDQDESPWVNSSNLTIVNDIPDVVIEYPGNWSSITNRTPTFNWSVIDGDEKDTITYDFRINETKFAGAATCVGLDDALDGISQNYYTPASILDCLYDNGYFYNWSVRAYDGEEYGEWTHAYVNITADTTITLTNDVINFGYLWPTNSTDTTSGLDPLVVQNDGNAIVNVSINSSALWFTELLDSQYYQFKIDNVTGESNAFNWTGSITSWFNMPITGDVIAIDQLNYTDSKDSVEVDVRLEVPPNEPPGAKISTIVFTSRLDE